MGDLVLSDAAINAMLDALDTHVNTGAGTAILRLYVGVEGNDPALVPAGTALQDINLANPAFGASAVTGATGSEVATITLSTDTPQAITTTGDAGSFAILNRNGDMTLKGDVTATGGGGMLELTAIAIAGSGADLTNANCTISLPLNHTV